MIPNAVLLASLLQGALTVASEVELHSPQPEQYGSFGSAVAIETDRAYAADGFGTEHVRQFSRSGASWTYSAELPQVTQIDIDAAYCRISGDWMLLSQPLWGIDGGAWMFRRVAGNWQFFQPLPVSNNFGVAQLHGWSVALDGERAAIGNPTDAQFYGGVVCIWEYASALGYWRIKAAVKSSGVSQQGAGVALRGDDLLVASRIDVRHYRFDVATSEWLLQGVVLAGLSGVGSGPTSATSHPLSLSPDGVLLVGDLYDASQGPYTGAAHVLERIGPSWTATAVLHAPVAAAGAYFGASAEARGDVLAVAAPSGQANGTGAGAVEFFSRNGGWQPVLTLTASDTVAGDVFGTSIAVDEDVVPLRETVIVGAPGCDDVATRSGSSYVFELDHANAVVYCTSKLNSLGCVPRVAFSGVPSASGASAFTVSATQVLSHKNGVFFYGTSGRAAVPFQGAFRCVNSPTRRTGTLFSGGNAANDCSGVLSLDFNTWIQSGNDPALVAGAVVDGQFWYRDGAASFGTGLSEAIELVVQP